MANIKITDLTAYADPASTDVLPIVDVGADVTKKVSIADLLENAGSGTAAAPGIAFDGDSDTGIYRPDADQLAISTNGAQRLFIDANGNVDVGEHLSITSTGQAYWGTSAPTTSSFGTSIGRSVLGLFENYRDGTALQVSARIGGTLGEAFVLCDGDLQNTNNSYAGISDIKLKENIVDANSQWNDIKALQVRNYNFKAETGRSTHTQIGLIAQEVELVSPGLVGTSIDDETGESTKNVRYSVLYMKAVKALQEAMERIEQLEAKVAALEAQ